MPYRLGIDIGSKTVKLVFLDENNRTVFSQYSLHQSDILSTFSELLGNTIWRFDDQEVLVCVTGSAGMRLAEELALPFEQEVIATRQALAVLLPKADVAIELGGEDAKVLFLRDGVEQRMNGTCAGGTGGFIDLMRGLLDVSARDFNSLAGGYSTIYPIASRCAVFAGSDVRPLINEGARRSDIAASVLQAVVVQTIAGLSCGRRIEGSVAFLGGPLEVYPELVQRFRRTLGLSFAQTLKPADAHLFVASGAALLAGEKHGLKTVRLSELKAKAELLPKSQDGDMLHLPALFANETQLQDFKQRHKKSKVERRQLMNYQGDIYLGIDAGSTTFKLVAIDEQGRLLYSGYDNNRGDLIASMRAALGEFYHLLPHELDGTPMVDIKRLVVTGYGEQMLKAALNADAGEVETVAHLRAAQEFDPNVDFILDIGGQDIKCLRLKNGQIDDIMLNEACSSGCGALIEGFSKSLGYTKWSFSDIALEARRPVDLGTRCTVFMTSRVRHAQKEGVPIADIAAGLAYSVVRNALYKVIGCALPAQIGQHVVVQGGTFMSDAVLRAFELECGLEVTRPNIANLMGAYGAALLAKDQYQELYGEKDFRSGILSPSQINSLAHQQSTQHCSGCTNNCQLTISTFVLEDELGDAMYGRRSFVTGNRCERGAQLHTSANQPKTDSKNANKLANLFSFQQKLLHQIGHDKANSAAQQTKPLVGIVPVLDTYETYPYWRKFFFELGFAVAPLTPSSTQIYRQGAQAVLSESVCYPAKLTHGQIANLIEQGVDYVFMPTGGLSDMECPVSAGYGKLAAGDVQSFAGQAGFLSVDLAGCAPDAAALAEMFTAADIAQAAKTAKSAQSVLAATMYSLDLSVEKIELALQAAWVAQQDFLEKLQAQTQSDLARLERSNRIGIVLAGHPYHTDQGLSHSIDMLLNTLGFDVFSVTGLGGAMTELETQLNAQTVLRSSSSKGDERARAELAFSCVSNSATPAQLPASDWRQAQRLYSAADFVAGHPQLELVQLHSFGCGIDALTTSGVREILERSGKSYTALKIDEMVDISSIRIRLRSLAYALKRRSKTRPALSQTLNKPDDFDDRSVIQVKQIILPALAPDYLEAIKAALANQPVQILVLAPISQQDIETGLLHLNNDLCHQMLAVGGQVINWALAQPKNIGPTSILIPKFCFACRGIELERVIRRALKNAKTNSNIMVEAIPSDHNATLLSIEASEKIYDAIEMVDAGEQNGFCQLPRVGIIGNPAMLYTSELNNDILGKIRAEGCVPVLPPLTELLLANAPLQRSLPKLVQDGIKDFIYVQSFGCLTAHINGRGAINRLKEQYPDISITFIDYDSGTSQVNQLNRLKLALSIAKERRL